MNNNQVLITVVIPSNRYECIREILEKSIFPYAGTVFSFEIHDSSKDSQIRKIISDYPNMHKSLRYFRYPDNITADDKAIQALSQVKSEYFWLMGDGVLVDFTKIEKIFRREKFTDYVVIDVESINRIGHMGQDQDHKSNHIYRHTDATEFAVKYFSHLTYWGAPLIKTAYYRQVYQNGILKKYHNQQIPWWIACTLFEQLARSVSTNEKVCMGVIYTDTIKSNTHKKDHWWSEDERYYEYTFHKFNLGIQLLPSFYSDDVKKNIIKKFRKDALVSDFYLIHLRAIDNLKLETLQKYKSEINIIPESYTKMYVYHCLPRIIAKILDFAKVQLRPFYFKIKRRMYS